MCWLAAVPLAIWIYLLVGHGQFWRTGIRLPPRGDATDPGPTQWPSVAVLVPARDEAELLATTLPTLLAQHYPGPARVILIDDQSSDGTGDAARAIGEATVAGLALTVVRGSPRPAGWAGKLWALHQGTSEAEQSGHHPPAEFLLLTDADIAHGPDSLRQLVSWALAARLDSVSLMARLRTDTGWERFIVPAFVYLFAQLYPFRRVNRRGARTAAAAGGCVLVRCAALRRAGGVTAVRGAVIDDVALARALKRSGAAIWLGLADEVVSARPYPQLADLWDMVARSAYTQLRYSVLLLAGTLLGLAVVFAGPPVALVVGLSLGDPLLSALGAAAWLLMAASYVPMLRYYHLSALRAPALPATAALYGAMTLTSALRHWRGGVTWKGRRY